MNGAPVMPSGSDRGGKIQPVWIRSTVPRPSPSLIWFRCRVAKPGTPDFIFPVGAFLISSAAHSAWCDRVRRPRRHAPISAWSSEAGPAITAAMMNFVIAKHGVQTDMVPSPKLLPETAMVFRHNVADMTCGCKWRPDNSGQGRLQKLISAACSGSIERLRQGRDVRTHGPRHG